MSYEIREVRESDLRYLTENLRSADVRELIATNGSPDIHGVLTRSYKNSDECLVGCPGPGENPVVMWGIAQWTARSALIWACATNKLVENRMAFLRNCRPVIKRWFEERPSLEYLMNFTHAQNTDHHKWLLWCGAELLPALPSGPRGELFHPFTIRRQKYHV